MRVVNALALLPIKNVLFETDDQTNILKIYSVVKSVVEERSYRNPTIIAADITEELLSNNNYYSAITSRTIIRWCSVLNKSNKKPGRRINVDFEADVWGNIMLCMFEKNKDEKVKLRHLRIA